MRELVAACSGYRSSLLCEEHPICFLPSYKWRPDTDSYDMRVQKHVPAWTDRILFRSKSNPAAIGVAQYKLHPGALATNPRGPAV